MIAELDTRSIEDLRGENLALRESNAEMQRRLTARGEELDALVLELSGLERTVGALERTIEALRSDSQGSDLAIPAGAGRAKSAAANPLAASSRDWEELLATVERQRQRTIEDVRNAADSRAWRWGHGLTRSLRTLTFRRSAQRLGALEILLQRLEAETQVPPRGAETPETDRKTSER